MSESYLHHEMKFDTLSRAKKVPLFAAGKKCTFPIARIGPARPDVIDFVIDLLRACRLAKYSSAASRRLFACCKLNRIENLEQINYVSLYTLPSMN